MAPVLWSGICLLVLLAGSLTSEAVDGPDSVYNVTSLLGLIFFALTPYAFLFGLLRSRVLQAGAVTELLHRMGEGTDRSGLREMLSAALGDRSLQVVYWLEDKRRWVDAAGRPTALPDEDDPARAVTRVEREGRAVGAIVHDRALCEDPELVGSVAAAAGLSIENERLQAQLRARVEELRASRARIVEAGHRRAAAAGAQPARRRAAAARRALADDAARAGQAAQGPRHGREAARRARRRS